MDKYSEGPVCGIENCPSKLWRRINGRSVCQFGHVNEYDVEQNDDDNYVEGVQTRKVNKIAGVTRNTVEHELMRDFLDSKLSRASLTPKRKKIVRERTLQIVIAKQCNFVIKRFNLTGTNKDTFLKIIKGFWIHELLLTQGITLNSVTLKVYFAMLKTGIPVYLCDFISMMEEEKFPYAKVGVFLPRDLSIIDKSRGKLNTDFIQHMISTMTWKMQKSRFLLDKNLALNYYPFIIRFVLQLRLPFEIIILTHKLIQAQNIKFKFLTREYNHPEIALCGLIVGMTKLYFTVNPEIYPSWLNTFYKCQSSPLANDFEIQRLNSRFMVRHGSTLKDLMKWDNEKIDNFIKYYRDTFLNRHKVQSAGVYRKITDMNKLQELKVLDSIFNVEFEKFTKEQKEEIYMNHLKENYNGIYQGNSEEVEIDIFEKCPIFMEIAGKYISSMYNCTTEMIIFDLKWAAVNIQEFINSI